MGRNFCPAAAFSFWVLLVLFREAASEAPSVKLTEGCGARPAMVNIATETRIAGGHIAQLGAWPWQVSLQIYHVASGRYRHVCGGSLINKNSVLTVAHCIKKWVNPEYWRVVIGLHHLYKPHSHTISRRVKNIVIHSGFKQDSYENDIAMFKLLKLVPYNEYIQPICLPQISHLVTDKSSCYVSGWGERGKKGSIQTELQEARANIIPLHNCSKYESYEERSTNTICAASQSDSCEADSGGPLMCYFPDDSKYYLIGIITSFASGCIQHNYPSLYIHTVSYRKWIDLHLYDKTTTMNVQSILVLLTMEWVTFYLI